MLQGSGSLCSLRDVFSWKLSQKQVGASRVVWQRFLPILHGSAGINHQKPLWQSPNHSTSDRSVCSHDLSDISHGRLTQQLLLDLPCHWEGKLANLGCCRRGSQLRWLEGRMSWSDSLSLSNHTNIKFLRSPLCTSSGLEHHFSFPLKSYPNAHVIKRLLSMRWDRY